MLQWFMNPAFLLGAAAFVLPVFIHLLTRRRYKRVRWAAMEFLLKAYKKTNRRLRFENLLVLMLRVLAVILFALALARPVAKETSALAEFGEKNRTVFLILDNSYSMSRRQGETTPFENGKRLLGEILGSLESGSDTVSLMLASSMPQTVFPEPTPDVERVRDEIGNLSPGMGITDLRPSFITLLELFQNPQVGKAPNKVVYVLTDLQRQAWIRAGSAGEEGETLETLLGRLTEKVDSVHVVDVGFEETDNFAVSDFQADDKIVGLDKSASFTVTVQNHSRERAEDLNVEFFVDGAPKGNKVVTVEAGRAAGVNFTTIFREPGPHRLKATVTADNLPVDNTRYFAVNVREKLDVLLVDGEPFEEETRGLLASETAYLRLALMPVDETRAPGRSSIIRPVVKKYFEVGSDTYFSRYQVVVLANEGRLVTSDFEVVEALENYVRAGGSVLLFLGDRIKPEDYNLRLYREGEGILPLKLTEILGDAEQLVSIKPRSFIHPILAVFDDKELKKLVTHDYTTFFFGTDEKSARDGTTIIARYDDEARSPAIVEKALGHGRIIMVTTTCDREWTTIPAHFVFLPFLHEMVYYLAHEATGQRNLDVGGLIQKILTQQQYSETVEIVLPSGARPAVEPPRRLDHGRFGVTYGPVEQVGIYELSISAGEEVKELYAVNVNTRESDLTRIGEEELEMIFPPQARKKLVFSTSVEGSAKPEIAGGSEFWRHLLIAVVILLVLETILAQRFGNYAR